MAEASLTLPGRLTAFWKIQLSAAMMSLVNAVMHGGEPLQEVIGELMLCVIASWLAIHGRGYLAREELPRPTRPAPGYARVG